MKTENVGSGYGSSIDLACGWIGEPAAKHILCTHGWWQNLLHDEALNFPFEDTERGGATWNRKQ